MASHFSLGLTVSDFPAMLVSVNVLAYWVSPLRLVLNLTKSLSWITPPPDSLHSACALEAMKNAEKAAVAKNVDTFIFIPFSSIYPTFSEEFKKIRGEVSPNLFFDPLKGAFKRTTEWYYSPGYPPTG